MFSCPCCKNFAYKACCAPYHTGKAPENALLLMRSRYSAYALRQADYILKTEHPTLRAKQEAAHKETVEDFCTKTTFEKLVIYEFLEEKERSYVTFEAHLSQNGASYSFLEKSLFLLENGLWLYADGEIKRNGEIGIFH
ncbi:MAG: YchJ family metal-binding protein [Chlamydiota bacterium]